MNRGDAVTFVTKFGDRATGVYLEPSLGGHLIASDDCFGADHSIGTVQCFIPSAPTMLSGAAAAKVRKRMAGKY